MRIDKERINEVVDNFDYLADNLPSATKKLNELLVDYRDAENDGELAEVLKELYDVAEEIQGYAADAISSFDDIADEVDNVLEDDDEEEDDEEASR